MASRLGEGGSVRYAWALALAAIVAIASLAAAEHAAAATGERSIVFVVDTSTSMSGEPLEEAKQALKGGTASMPGANVGLRSFGGECGNPGLVRLALGPFDEPSFIAAVDELEIGPMGTPTPSALRAAAATLPASGDRTIILISDGGSSCGDPCDTARELQSRMGAGFRIDTVGFRAPNDAESQLDCVARATGGSYISVSDTAGLQRALAQSAAARVTAMRLSPARFAAARRGPSIVSAPKRRVGTRVLYTISKSVAVRFTLEKAAVGRRVGGECRKPTRRTMQRRACTRYVKLAGSLLHDARAGANRFYFTGRWGSRTLRPGRYRLLATAIDTSGTLANPLGARFTIVRARR